MFPLILLGLGGLLLALATKAKPAPGVADDGPPPPPPPGPELPHADPIEQPEDEYDLGDFNTWELPNPMFWYLGWRQRIGLFGNWYIESAAHDGRPPVAGERLHKNPMFRQTYSLRGSRSAADAGRVTDVVWAPWTYPPEEGGQTVLRQLMIVDLDKRPNVLSPDQWIEIGEGRYTYEDVWSDTLQVWQVAQIKHDEPLHQFVLLGS